MKIRMLNNLIGVEQVGKTTKNDGMFAETEVTHNLGLIKFVGESADEKFSVGQKIYFGNERESIIMSSEEVLIMKDTNIYAIVEDVSNEEKAVS